MLSSSIRDFSMTLNKHRQITPFTVLQHQVYFPWSLHQISKKNRKPSSTNQNPFTIRTYTISNTHHHDVLTFNKGHFQYKLSSPSIEFKSANFHKAKTFSDSNQTKQKKSSKFWMFHHHSISWLSSFYYFKTIPKKSHHHSKQWPLPVQTIISL